MKYQCYNEWQFHKNQISPTPLLCLSVCCCFDWVWFQKKSITSLKWHFMPSSSNTRMHKHTRKCHDMLWECECYRQCQCNGKLFGNHPLFIWLDSLEFKQPTLTTISYSTQWWWLGLYACICYWWDWMTAVQSCERCYYCCRCLFAGVVR